MRREGDLRVEFLDALEALVVRLLVVGLLALILAQGLMSFPGLRRHLSLTDRLEGERFTGYSGAAQASKPGGAVAEAGQGVPQLCVVSLELIGLRSLERAVVLVNGAPVGDFDYPIVTFDVRQGDLLEIACPRLSMPVSFRVRMVSAGVAEPAEGAVYEGRTRLVLGRVSLKS